MTPPAPEITFFDLGVASVLVVAAGFVSLYVAPNLKARLVWAAARAFLQLAALGLVLGWVFEVANPLVVALFVAIMLLESARMAKSRVKTKESGMFLLSLYSLSAPTLAVTAVVTVAVIGAKPWYDARVVIPIAGMILGNAMNAVSVSLDRMHGDLSAERDKIFALLALGAKPREAVRGIMQNAFGAGLIPTLNTMGSAGIVFIPGMMTGQVLAGADPLVAARYQIMVLFMIAAATAIGSAMAVLMAYRKSFDEEGRFIF